MPPDPDRILELETLAAAAWPAAHREPLGGWALRYSGGGGRRANSAWTAGHPGLAPEEAVARVEAFYRARGAPARFQIGPATRPDGLRALLAARGYLEEAPTEFRTAPLEALAAADEGVGVADAPGLDWLALWDRPERDALGLLRGVTAPSAFAVLHDGRGPAAIGRGVLVGARLGVFDMLTRPDARRRGSATRVLGALAGWGLARGAERLFLQVEEANAAATALYARRGLRVHHGYRFMTRTDTATGRP